MAEAVLTLSQTPNRTNHDHTADDFTVGRRVKAHLRRLRSCVGMCTGLSSTLVAAQSDWCWSRWIAAASVLVCSSQSASC